jgi:hypothetical protein
MRLTVPPWTLALDVSNVCCVCLPFALSAVIHEGVVWIRVAPFSLPAPHRAKTAPVWNKQPDLFASIASFDRTDPSKQQRSSKPVHVLNEGSSSF